MSASSVPATECHVLTPPGMGALAVIRVHGPDAVAAVAPFFHPTTVTGRPTASAVGEGASLGPEQPHRLRYGRWVADGEIIDDVILWAGPGPTGELCVDINAHAGIRIVERILMSLRDHGVALGEPGTAIQHAWAARNRIDGEILAEVSRAKTRRAVEFLMGQRRTLPAHLEALADRCGSNLAAVRRALADLEQEAIGGRLLVEGATVALIGPPNAGKSTLANRLFGAPMAVVSPSPGTTRDWVAEPAALNGIPVTLVDTAGMRSRADPIEAEAIRRARQQAERADLVLAVMDTAAAWPGEFWRTLTDLRTSGTVLTVLNKADLPRRWGPDELPPGWRDQSTAVSALTGLGMPALVDRMAVALHLGDADDSAARLFTERQRRVVTDILGDPALPPDEIARLIRHDLIGPGQFAATGAG